MPVLVTCISMRTHAGPNVFIDMWIHTCIHACLSVIARNFDVELTMCRWVVPVWSICMYVLVHVCACVFDIFIHSVTIYPVGCVYTPLTSRFVRVQIYAANTGVYIYIDMTPGKTQTSVFIAYHWSKCLLVHLQSIFVALRFILRLLDV